MEPPNLYDLDYQKAIAFRQEAIRQLQIRLQREIRQDYKREREWQWPSKRPTS